MIAKVFNINSIENIQKTTYTLKKIRNFTNKVMQWIKKNFKQHNKYKIIKLKRLSYLKLIKKHFLSQETKQLASCNGFEN